MDFAIFASGGNIEISQIKIHTIDPILGILKSSPYNDNLFVFVVVGCIGCDFILIVVDLVDMLEMGIFFAQFA